jgi:CDP-diacylglycerol--glycerol-3-phosphate 3-phosphatidyltransferase
VGDEEESRALNLANTLTLLRVFSSAVFFFIYASASFLGLGPMTLVFSLFFLYGFLELTDALDGYVARRFAQVTDLGKVLDPMADGVARVTILLAFTLPPVQLPTWLVLPFLFRDAMTATLRIVCAWRGIVLAARASGKIKAVVQACTAFLVLILMGCHAQGIISAEELTATASTAVAISAAYAVGAAFEYLIALRHQLRALTAPAPAERALGAVQQGVAAAL